MIKCITWDETSYNAPIASLIHSYPLIIGSVKLGLELIRMLSFPRISG
jgi:hypothetical protein